MRPWTKEEIENLKQLYINTSNDKLVEFFGRAYSTIYKKARDLNIYRSEELKTLNRRNAHSGEKAANWKGGKKTNYKGYVLVLNKEHPRANRNGGYVFEHILIMEQYLGRYLNDDEIVHHLNEIKDDNRIENLELMTVGEHTKLHHIGSKRSFETRRKISEKAKERHKNKIREVNSL